MKTPYPYSWLPKLDRALSAHDTIPVQKDGNSVPYHVLFEDLQSAVVGDESAGLVKDVNALKISVNTPTTGLLDQVAAIATAVPIVGSAPVMAQTYALGKIHLTGNPTQGDTLVVGKDKTYTFVSELPNGGEANQILICGNNVPSDTAKAIEYAINASTGDGHAAYYGTGTTPNQDVVATASGGDVSLTCEGSENAATLIGKNGNNITLAENANNLTVDPFADGVDITGAAAGKIIIANGIIYVAKAECTATENNWFQISADV